MATPIKITPMLSNQDSTSFNRALSQTENAKVSEQEKRSIFSLVEKVLAKKITK